MDHTEDQMSIEIDPLMKQAESRENIEMQQVAEN